MTLVWRIEDEKGEGPYRLTEWDWIDEKHETDGAERPDPRDDDGELRRLWDTITYKEKTSYLFGFSSLVQLTKWFSEQEIKDLYDIGFHIAVYNATIVVESSHQCAFIPAPDNPKKFLELKHVNRFQPKSLKQKVLEGIYRIFRKANQNTIDRLIDRIENEIDT